MAADLIQINRILELGGKPTTDIMKASTCGFSEPPEDYSDLTRVIELVIESKRYAIQKYNTLAKKISYERPSPS